MSATVRVKPLLLFGGGLSLGLLVGVGMLVGSLVSQHQSADTDSELPEIVLRATATHGNDSLIMATGLIDDDVEGLYILDCLTGDLYCWVILPRTGRGGALYKTNVLPALDIDASKKPKFLMTTGLIEFVSATGQQRPARSVVYVADGNSGAFAAYALMWNRTLAQAGKPQGGELIYRDGGKARSLEAIRE